MTHDVNSWIGMCSMTANISAWNCSPRCLKIMPAAPDDGSGTKCLSCGIFFCERFYSTCPNRDAAANRDPDAHYTPAGSRHAHPLKYKTSLEWSEVLYLMKQHQYFFPRFLQMV